MKMNKDKDIGDDASYFKSQVTRHKVMGTELEKTFKLALLLYSLTNLTNYQTFRTSINTLSEKMTSWDYVTTVLIEEEKRVDKRIINILIKVDGVIGPVAVSVRGNLHRINIS